MLDLAAWSRIADLQPVFTYKVHKECVAPAAAPRAHRGRARGP